MNPKISIIILNWNGFKDTLDCLISISHINYGYFNIILVDNNSDDNSVENFRECDKLNKTFLITIFEENEFKKQSKKFNQNNRNLIILKASKNYGFAKGNNIGIKFALENFSPQYILLLNNDTIVTKNFLEELLNAVNEENLGILAPKLLNAYNHQLIDSTGHIFSWGRIIDRGHNNLDKCQFDQELVVIGAKAAAALYNVQMLNSIGLFNENYVTNYEDAELSWRAYKHSWKAIYVPKSIVYHKISKSIKKDEKTLIKMSNLSFNNIVFTVKNYGTIIQKLSFTFILIKEIFNCFIKKVIFKPNYLNTKQIIMAILDLYKS